ncbi:MAG: hypothetical protein ACRCYU_14645 [Nocardioides sp.]
MSEHSGRAVGPGTDSEIQAVLPGGPAEGARVEFEEYVAARRGTLMRAAVLLGHPLADAEDLVQATLTRTLVSWSKVRRAGNPNEQPPTCWGCGPVRSRAGPPEPLPPLAAVRMCRLWRPCECAALAADVNIRSLR